MKSIYKFSLVALAIVGLSACNQEANTTEAAAANVELKTEAQKEAYSVGASIGKYMSGHIKEQEALGMPVDRSLIVSGFSSGLNDELKLTEEEMQTVLKGLDEKLNKKREAQETVLAEKALADSSAFLKANQAKEGVVTTESGLQYEVLTPGTGEKPSAEDTVEVDYVGTLLDGTEFDSSIARGEPAKFPLNRVIAGWTEGVQLMSVGAKYKFVIPADLAYGERNTGTIPANSTLIFEITLHSIEKAGAPTAEVAGEDHGHAH
ncbi:FKBP-type peptidyl-prolyl cis-trans isomerase [Shewanella violacea]|uniref:Peptidyl-prolyl cis-trans isomerase n=1 Tax=Shewanella violacea (strain JCM 10179 / CIP 106290 / LMG 19151 / DSS12) TaxID=637905 RepID=D4ZGD1_SHEVD|nr:FKBP-type peptidyl-prolyl cis-trans isomerase [Shewanella violacea]BAJ00730.1 FKBP-type peptidyl-prolyl cis-trans isomerase FkpA [Shewanella violacea DSS12]